MTTYQKLRQFIQHDMRMSQVYQPVMLIELLRGNGKAILDRDPTQIDYFS
jgi:hypothetical protein